MIPFHTLRRTQWIPRPLHEVFAFFSNAHNLEQLTPDWLRFEVITPGPILIAAGTHIQYKLKWHGVPIDWTTEIRRWNPPYLFVDVQLRGPYKLWHHTHRFVCEAGGTRIDDTLRYRIPLGGIGRVMHAIKIRRDIEQIFAYRFDKIAQRFSV